MQHTKHKLIKFSYENSGQHRKILIEHRFLKNVVVYRIYRNLIVKWHFMVSHRIFCLRVILQLFHDMFTILNVKRIFPFRFPTICSEITITKESIESLCSWVSANDNHLKIVTKIKSSTLIMRQIIEQQGGAIPYFRIICLSDV